MGIVHSEEKGHWVSTVIFCGLLAAMLICISYCFMEQNSKVLEKITYDPIRFPH